jgi:VanZ family protein
MTRRARLAVLTALFVGCAAYGSFVPLVWRPLSWSAGLARFMHLPVKPFEHLWTGDFFTNILVFLPIGFFALGWTTSSKADPKVCARSQGVATVLVVLSCGLLSGLLELGQIYIVARTPSWSDVFAQTLGAVVGVTLWLTAGTSLVTWVASPLRAHSRDQRLHQLLALYATGWMALAALPIFFPRIAHPLLNELRSRMDLSPLSLLGPLVVAAVGAIPLGVFGARMARREDWRGVVAAAGGPVLLVLADRVRQVQFLPAEGHLAANLVGFAIGWLAAAPPAARLRAWCATRAPIAVGAALAAAIGLVVVRYLAPFNFGVRPAVLEWRIRVLYERAPFHRYYWTPPLIALNEAVTLMLLGGLCGALLRRLRSRRLSVAACTALTTLLFTAIEWWQLYLPARRADPTDIMLAAAGAFVGTVVSRAIEPSPQAPRAW